MKLLETKLNYKFKNVDSLIGATFRHQYLQKVSHPKLQSGLATLGDAVLDTCIIEYYFRKGITRSAELDAKRKKEARNIRLTELAKSINSAENIFWGSSEHNRKTWNQSQRMLATCFEAIIGAIFLDSDIEAVKAVLKYLSFFQDV